MDGALTFWWCISFFPLPLPPQYSFRVHVDVEFDCFDVDSPIYGEWAKNQDHRLEESPRRPSDGLFPSHCTIQTHTQCSMLLTAMLCACSNQLDQSSLLLTSSPIPSNPALLSSTRILLLELPILVARLTATFDSLRIHLRIGRLPIYSGNPTATIS